MCLFVVRATARIYVQREKLRIVATFTVACEISFLCPEFSNFDAHQGFAAYNPSTVKRKILKIDHTSFGSPRYLLE
jgi:hypothetical protein